MMSVRTSGSIGRVWGLRRSRRERGFVRSVGGGGWGSECGVVWWGLGGMGRGEGRGREGGFMILAFFFFAFESGKSGIFYGSISVVTKQHFPLLIYAYLLWVCLCLISRPAPQGYLSIILITFSRIHHSNRLERVPSLITGREKFHKTTFYSPLGSRIHKLIQVTRVRINPFHRMSRLRLLILQIEQ